MSIQKTGNGEPFIIIFEMVSIITLAFLCTNVLLQELNRRVMNVGGIHDFTAYL